MPQVETHMFEFEALFPLNFSHIPNAFDQGCVSVPPMQNFTVYVLSVAIFWREFRKICNYLACYCSRSKVNKAQSYILLIRNLSRPGLGFTY